MRIPFLPPALMAAFWRFYRRTEQAELDLIAAGVAFYGFLAIFPAAAAIIAIWGFMSDPQVIRDNLEMLRPMLPPEAFALIAGQVDALLSVTTTGIGVTTLLSTALALWSARAGVAALIRGLNAIYHLPNRAGHWHQLRAIVLTFVLIGLALTTMIMTVLMPLIIGLLPLADAHARMISDANLLIAVALVVVSISLAYRLGPNHGALRPPLFSWGLVVAVVLWVAAARGFMLYLANFPSYNRVYGSIGAVVALLFWLYVSAYAILLGAAVDAERNRSRASQKKS